MKFIMSLLFCLALAACTSVSVTDGGDGVYYAESPPSYVYVDSYVGFAYAGPYAWSWYHPVWYSPLAGGHYYWSWSAGTAPFVSGKGAGPRQDLLPGAPVTPGQLAILPVDSRLAFKKRFNDQPGRKYAGSAKSPARNYSRQSAVSTRRPMAPSSSSRMARPSSAPRNSEHEH